MGTTDYFNPDELITPPIHYADPWHKAGPGEPDVKKPPLWARNVWAVFGKEAMMGTAYPLACGRFPNIGGWWADWWLMELKYGSAPKNMGYTICRWFRPDVTEDLVMYQMVHDLKQMDKVQYCIRELFIRMALRVVGHAVFHEDWED